MTARDLGTNKAQAMQKLYGGTKRSHDCYLERCVKNSLTQYSFYVMESRVSSDCTHNIHRPSTPEKEVNRKENTVGKNCQKATDSKVNTCSDIDLGQVLFHYVIFCDKEIRIFPARCIAFPSVEFHRICWTL